VPFLPEFLTVVVVHLLGVMSPGPDFVLVTRNSLLYSRKTAVRTALGQGLGVLVRVAYGLIGVDFILSRSVHLFLVPKFLGASYLIYVGYRSFRAKRQLSPDAAGSKRGDLGTLTAIRLGFLSNLLNPKAALFFLAFFSDVISPLTPKSIQILYGLEMSGMSFV
jgi:threonine/homoserine/homoserine lactone efflux protein